MEIGSFSLIGGSLRPTWRPWGREARLPPRRAPCLRITLPLVSPYPQPYCMHRPTIALPLHTEGGYPSPYYHPTAFHTVGWGYLWPMAAMGEPGAVAASKSARSPPAMKSSSPALAGNSTVTSNQLYSEQPNRDSIMAEDQLSSEQPNRKFGSVVLPRTAPGRLLR